MWNILALRLQEPRFNLGADVADVLWVMRFRIEMSCSRRPGVAPWSPRAGPGAGIAFPLSWAQIKAGLDQAAVNLMRLC
jgi:hypothetical protein